MAKRYAAAMMEVSLRYTGYRRLPAKQEERLIGETTTRETRYFISSSLALASRILTAVRLHWGIENRLHWVLDMSFGEDQSRIRKDNAPTNVGIIRHAALNMIRQVHGMILS